MEVDDGYGVLESEAGKIVNNIIINANNPQKLDPPFYHSRKCANPRPVSPAAEQGSAP